MVLALCSVGNLELLRSFMRFCALARFSVKIYALVTGRVKTYGSIDCLASVLGFLGVSRLDDCSIRRHWRGPPAKCK